MYSPIVNFLISNGFNEVGNYKFTNTKCEITIIDDISQAHYVISDITDDTLRDTIHSDNLNIYWLIGYLTYYDYINKEYKQFEE